MKQQRIAALVALSTQNTALILVTKYSCVRRSTPYHVSVVVASAELLKLVCSLCILSYAEGISAPLKAVYGLRLSSLQLAIPAVLYLVQTVLLFEGVRLLSPTLYIVCTQAKILSSALFAYLILDANVTRTQLAALACLACGMLLVQLSEQRSLHTDNSGSVSVTRGILVVLLAALISGFTGAYLEKMYKGGRVRRDMMASIWFQNAQLACFSLPTACLLASWKDHVGFAVKNIFQGFDVVVVFIVILHAAGGLLVAAVMRYASNVLKCFAVSISICACTATTLALDGDEYTTGSIISLTAGLSLVIFSTLTYSRNS